MKSKQKAPPYPILSESQQGMPEKAINVLMSCRTSDQLSLAWKYVNRMHRQGLLGWEIHCSLLDIFLNMDNIIKDMKVGS